MTAGCPCYDYVGLIRRHTSNPLACIWTALECEKAVELETGATMHDLGHGGAVQQT